MKNDAATEFEMPCYEVENLHCAARYLLDYAPDKILDEDDFTDRDSESSLLSKAKRLLIQKLTLHIKTFGFTPGLHQLFQCVHCDFSYRHDQIDTMRGALANKDAHNYVDFFVRTGSPSAKKIR